MSLLRYLAEAARLETVCSASNLGQIIIYVQLAPSFDSTLSYFWLIRSTSSLDIPLMSRGFMRTFTVTIFKSFLNKDSPKFEHDLISIKVR